MCDCYQGGVNNHVTKGNTKCFTITSEVSVAEDQRPTERQIKNEANQRLFPDTNRMHKPACMNLNYNVFLQLQNYLI